jgi:hypothetical protein
MNSSGRPRTAVQDAASREGCKTPIAAGQPAHTQFNRSTAQQADQRGFPQDDKLYQIALRTDQDLRHLCMELHYLSCKSGVGREKKD